MDTLMRYPPLYIKASVLPTLNRETSAVHEVKGYRTDSGILKIGLGLVRGGMCLIDMDSSGEVIVMTHQAYDFNRTQFPDTVINPYKWYFDSTEWAGPRQNKWDRCLCHSVLPYEYGGGRYVLTTDEYARWKISDSLDFWPTKESNMPDSH
jgi:hypothetical protein